MQGPAASAGGHGLAPHDQQQHQDGEGGPQQSAQEQEALQPPPPQWPAALMPQQQPRDEQQAQQQAQSMHHGGSFKTYMAHKNLKLQEQFEAAALCAAPASSLFRGVSIHVNGLTRPSHAELKVLMARHGGRFETYYSRARVTHIVCAHLPDTKLKQLAHARDPVPIVKPEWVVASLRAGTLLPVKDFLLQHLRDLPGQRTLFEHRAHAAPGLAPAELYPALQQQQQQQEQQQRDEQQQGEQQQQHQEQGEPSERAAPAAAAPPAAAAAPLPAAATGGNGGSQARAEATAAGLRAACDLLKGPPKTTADDPQGFVGSYFRSSRLHFIGSWKARVEALMADHYQAQQQQGQQQGQQQRLGGSSGHRQQQQQQQQQQRVIVHLDMDCFFAAVSAVGRPEFAGKPLAVCHSSSAQGSGEVSSANYEARGFGVAAGMMMAEAKARCPGLLVVPYEFEKYEEASLQVYRILLAHCPLVQPLSVDEAYADLTPLPWASSSSGGGPGAPEAAALVACIRREIQEATGCTASAGIGPNLLLARLATKRAKPNGQAAVTASEARGLLGDLTVDALPGVGWSLNKKLADMGITHVRQVWSSSKEVLCRRLGQATGSVLWQHAHGLDDRPVAPPRARRSVGAEVNWGVRFSSAAEADVFLQELCAEVSSRLGAAGARAKTVTLKLKRRQAGAPEPAKFLGHGACDNLSRSVTLARFVCSAAELHQAAAPLLTGLKVPVDEVRGLGITASKLDTDAASRDARPSAPQPAKLPPRARGVFDAAKFPFAAWVLPRDALQQGQQQQQTLPAAAAAAAGGGGGSRKRLAGDVTTSPLASFFSPAKEHEDVVLPQAAAVAAGAGPASKRRRVAAAAPAEAAPGSDPGAAGDGGSDQEEQQHAAAAAWLQQQQHEEQGLEEEDGCGFLGSLPEASPPDDAAAVAALFAAGENADSPPAKRRLFRGDRQQQQQPGAAGAGAPRLALPPAEQLDPEVLAALPDDLRREVEAAYRLQRGSSSHDNSGGSRQRHSPSAAAAAAAAVGGQRHGGSKRPRQQQSTSPQLAAAAAADAGEEGGGNWLTRVTTAAAAAQRQRRQQHHQQLWAHGGAGAGGRKQQGSRAHEQQQHRPASEPPLFNLDQVDPEVLAALPPELQQELRAALPGRLRNNAGAGSRAGQRHGSCGGLQAGRQGRVLCSQDPDPAPAAAGVGEQQQSSAQGWRHVGLGRLWQQQAPALFVDEPAADVLHALRAAVAVLAAGAAGAPGAAGSGDEDGQQQTQVQQEEQQQERRAKLAVLGEYLLQWLLAPGRDLDSVRRVLQGTASAGQQHAAFGGVAKRVVETVQAQVVERWGFALVL